jgi:hypothetical protein
MVPVYFAEVAHFAQPATQQTIWDSFLGAATFGRVAGWQTKEMA